MAGHMLNITITANETLKAANVTVFGITHVMILNNMTASANVTIDENTTEGYVLFNITAFDLAGNSITVNQTNLNSSNLTIDRTNPKLSAVSCKIKGCNVEIDLAISVTAIYYHACVCHHTGGVHHICGI